MERRDSVDRESDTAVEHDRVLAEALPHLVWTTLPDGTSDYFNKRWLEYTGIQVGEKGKAWTLVHPDDVAACAAKWKECFGAGTPYQIEYRLRRADGAYRWHLGLAHALRDASGAIVKWIGTSTDIHDQKRAAQREAFLAKTSSILGDSLDYETTVASVVSAAVPDFADACSLDLLYGDGLATRQVAVAHVDPAKAPLMRLFREKYPVDPREPYGTGEVIRSGKPEFHAEIPDALLDATARDAGYAPLLRQLGIKSTITVPLVVRGMTLGAVAFVLGASDRRYEAKDVEVALEVARRAAISLDNARLHKQARDEEERLRIAMDAGQMGSWEWDITAGRVVWSPSLERLHGIPVGSFEGTFEAYQRDMHPEDRPRVLATVTESLNTRKQHRLSYRIIRPDGAVRWLDAWGRFLLDERGEPTRLLGISMDVTDRRHAEEERARLLASEQGARAQAERAQRLMQTTLKSIGDAVIATDVQGLVTFMNGVAEALTGWTDVEARGRPLSEVFVIVNERTRKPIESPVDRVLRDGAIVGLANHTVLLGRGPGAETPIDDRGAPIRDDAGNLHGVVLVFRDVTQQKREEAKRDYLGEASAALASSLDYHATLASVARLAVPKLADWCSVDVIDDGEIGFSQVAVAHVDPAKVAMAEELGKRYPPDRNAPTGVPNVLRTGRSELYPMIPEELLRAGAKDAEHLRIIRELRLHSAMVVPLVARGRTVGAMTFVYAESGRSYGADDQVFAEELARRAAIAVDNARLYSSEQHARRNADEANRTKDEFLATVSHELRTPLNAMLGWARMLRAGTLPESRRLRAIETIERNAVAQTQLIEDLLDVSRIISGKLRLDVKSIELVDIIEEAIDSLRLAIEAKGIQLRPLLDPTAGEIMGDPVRLQQIVWNLLSNAIKFTQKKGQIRIVLERVDSQLALSVIDNGQGIRPDFLPFVFERFKQAEGGITRMHGGLGLGLAITRHLVELHGGNIEVHSKGEGEGSRFTVLLPLSPVRRSSSRPTPTRKPALDAAFECPPVLKELRVLVVDDEADARELIVAILEHCGAIVTSVASSSEALAAVVSGTPDVLISDIGMAEGDGYELIERVRRLPPESGGNVPAAALTAYARAEDRRRALDAGYMMHIPKPVEPAELVAVVANLARFRR